MTLHLVSRHPGAIDWMRRRIGLLDAVVHAHLDDIDGIRRGDVVCGVLPLPLVVALGERGATAVIIEMTLPAAMRGRELTAAELDRIGARLVVYEARRVREWPNAPHDAA